MLSEVLKDNDKKRIDSAYFSKSIIEIDKKVREFEGGANNLGEIFSRFSKGIFDINAQSYALEGIPFLRIGNLNKIIIGEHDDLVFIDKAEQDKNLKTAVTFNDIIISKTAYPAAAICYLEVANASQDTIVTSLSDFGLENYTQEYITAYLNTQIGKALSFRQFQGNVQLHLGLEDGRKIPIAKASMAFQMKIRGIFSESLRLYGESQRLQKESEEILIDYLGLSGWRSKKFLTYERSSRDVLLAERMDAEFFSPNVSELLRILNSDGKSIADVALVRHEKFKPLEGRVFDYIEIGGIRNNGTVEVQEVLGENAPSRATWMVRSGDVITSTIRPIRRLSAIISEKQSGSVCSSGLIVLEPKEVASEVLLAYLRLPYICQMLDLRTSASLYPSLSERDLMSMPIPIFDKSITERIIEYAQEATAMQNRSNELLKISGRAIEILIDESENQAEKFIDMDNNLYAK